MSPGYKYNCFFQFIFKGLGLKGLIFLRVSDFEVLFVMLP